jgi:hypothetical protein
MVRRGLMRIAKGLVIDLHRRHRLETAYLNALTLLPEREHPSAEEREIGHGGFDVGRSRLFGGAYSDTDLKRSDTGECHWRELQSL